MAITYGEIAGAEPSTVTFEVATVVIDRNSTTQHQEILVVGDPETSNAIARVVAGAPDSTHFGLVTRQVGFVAYSTLVTVRQSTAAEFQATVTPVSTVWAVQHSGPIIVRSTAAEALVTVYQSTASALQATARINTSSGGAVEGSTASPAHNAIGLHTREVLSSLQSTTLIITSSNSTAVYALVSSAAASHKVYAYFIGSTVTVPSTLVFMSSGAAGATDKWAVAFGSGSSGITGANVAVSPPGFLFRTVVNEALNCRVESGSTGQLTRVSLSWFTE